MRHKYLATGLGHSGTAWFAKFMTCLGFETGHESCFNFHGEGPLLFCESSWLAVPHLRYLPRGTPVVHLMRDPLLVLNSHLRSGLMASTKDTIDDKFANYVYRYMPRLRRLPNQVDRLMTYITDWDEPVFNYVPRLTFLVGHHTKDGKALSELVRFCTGKKVTPIRALTVAQDIGLVNQHHPDRESLYTWDTLPEGKLKEAMVKRCMVYYSASF